MMTTVFQRVRVGPYEIVHEIGRGGMAVVFFATDSRDGRRVALKLVPTGTDRDAQEVLEAERWGAKLQEQFCRISQNVPVVYEHGTEGGYFYIAMEYLDGRNLSEIVAGGPLAPDRAVGIAIQLCHFLEAAHGFEATVDGRKLRSLLHGDLKPRNIRVLWADKIKILDFGIAKALSLSRKVTRNDFGSITYLSPERLESGEIDTYSDFWAVGVLLYEMVGGVQPFRAPDTRRLEQRIPWGRHVLRRCRPSWPSSSRGIPPIDTAMPARFARISNASCPDASLRPNVKDGRPVECSTTSLRRGARSRRRRWMRKRRAEHPESRRNRKRRRLRRRTSSFGLPNRRRRGRRAAQAADICERRSFCSLCPSSETS